MLKRHLFTTVLLAVMVSACGFHLRGNIPLPASLNNLYLKVPQSQKSFRQVLAKMLENAGATVSDVKAGSNATLNLSSVKLVRDVGTMDERGKANSYKLSMTVKYQVIDPQGKEFRSETITESRIYDFSAERVVESESEERELSEDMEQDLSLRMIRQLSTMVNYPN